MVALVRQLLLACLTLPALAGSPSVTLDPPATSDVPPSFPVGKTLIFPITGADSASLPLSFTVTSSNPKILVRAKTGNPALRLAVGYGSGESGDLVFQLFRDWAPVSSGFIGGFAQASFYNSLTFHRILPGALIQGGDPLGNGDGGPGMTNNDPTTAFHFQTERNPGLIFSGRGQLAMANSGIFPANDSATNGSQFFISLDQMRSPTSANEVNFDFQYTIFGQLLRGWDVLAGIAAVPLQNTTTGQPASPVTITSADVEQDNHDAVLVISATAPGSAMIAVTAADGSGGMATQTFSVSAVADMVNDPPFFLPIQPQVVPVHTELDLPLHAYDLESDYIFYYDDGFLIPGEGDGESEIIRGSTLAIFGNAGFSGEVVLGAHLAQFDMTTGSNGGEEDPEPVIVGIGERAVRPEPEAVFGAPNQSLTNLAVGRLNDTDPAGTAANFTAGINWGDGTPVVVGAVAPDPVRPGLGHYLVTGSHQYAGAGIYTIVVSTEGTNGATATIRSPAIISAGPITALGQQLELASPTVANLILATFTDTRAGSADDYQATVNWGDGAVGVGVVSKLYTGQYLVRGTHTYRDAETYAVDVTIHKAGDLLTNDAEAWSTMALSGFNPPAHLPPFRVVHLLAAWNSGPTKSVTNALAAPFSLAKETAEFTGQIVIVNSGQLKSPDTQVRFWLSDDQVLNTTGANADQPLTANGFKELTIGPLTSGGSVGGSLTIALPKGESGGRKYLLAELVYSDPIIDSSAVPKVIVSGPIAPAILASGQSGSVTTRTGGSVTFQVVLDTAPTADVTVPIASSSASEGTVSASALTFTSTNWNTAQIVTVTGQADAKTTPQSYSISVGPATSADTLYNGVSGNTINLTNSASAAH